MALIVHSLTLSGRNFRWTDYRIHKSACCGHSISWHCFLACVHVYMWLFKEAGWGGHERLLSARGRPLRYHLYARRKFFFFFSCCLYSILMNKGRFSLCSVAAAVMYWAPWSPCKHWPTLSERQWKKSQDGDKKGKRRGSFEDIQGWISRWNRRMTSW